jgi:hypothetical protein
MPEHPHAHYPGVPLGFDEGRLCFRTFTYALPEIHVSALWLEPKLA